MFSRFFIERPVFSWVLAIAVMLVGLISMFELPVSQFPNIAPPRVHIGANYPGASAQTVSDTITQVLEKDLIGLDGYLYMRSNSNESGRVGITVTFAAGTDPDMAQVQVQNKVQNAIKKLPELVQRLGVRVNKVSGSYLMVMGFNTSDPAMSLADLSDYVMTNLVEPLSRVEGVGSVESFGAKYAMRIWMHPDKMAQYRINPDEVVTAIRRQNHQVSVGGFARQPTDGKQQYTATVTSRRMLTSPQEFENILLRVDPNGARVTLKDVAQVSVGQQGYSVNPQFNGKASCAVGIKLAPNANALAVSDRVMAKMGELKRTLPESISMVIPFDSTPYIRAALKEVVFALFEAIALVVLVMFLFLQNWRATLIPAIAVPVVLLGTLSVLHALDFSINMLSMFAMVLAIGLLVDDAIVVVENVERVMREKGLDAKAATIESMREIQGALIGIALVLAAVFVPMAFFGGSPGVIYRQFSVTIVTAMLFSVLVALTLTPSLCAQFLRPSDALDSRSWLAAFNRLIERLRGSVQRIVVFVAARLRLMLVLFAGMLGVIGYGFTQLPTAFMPAEDQGILMFTMKLPRGATLERTQRVLTRMTEVFNETEKDNLMGVLTMSGVSFAGSGQHLAWGYLRLKDWAERPKPEQSDTAVQQRIMKILSTWPDFTDAKTFVFPLPPVSSVGEADGFDCFIQDASNGSHEKLMAVTQDFIARANADPRLRMVRMNGLDDVEQLRIEFDDTKMLAMGLDFPEVDQALSSIIGGTYVNDYLDRGRIKQVWVQGDVSSRMQPEDLFKWQVRNNRGEMVPFSAFATIHWEWGSPKLMRFNGDDALHVQGNAAPGVSSGQAMGIIEELADRTLPLGYRVAWHGGSYQEKAAGMQGPSLYMLSCLVVFLGLAALYESWSIPLAVMLSVPGGLLGAMGLTWAAGMLNDVYFQVAMLTTIGLASKNAILIVEFAQSYVSRGADIVEAVKQAVKVRLRPILMTSLAFGVGVVPLMMATGPGSAAQRAIGTGVFGGMLTGTALCFFFVPVFYILIMRLVRRFK